MTQTMYRILVIEDDAAIRRVLRALLEASGFRMIESDTAARAEIEARSHKPDLLLVDLGLPDGDGLTVIRKVRAWSPVPIIVLSARTAEEQKIAALDAGADDYVAKPFSAPELLARIRAALRRSARGAIETLTLQLGEVTIELARRTAHRAGAAIHFTPLEYRVLECLARQAGSIVTQPQLLREVWGPQHADDTRNLRVCVKNLRQKFEPDSRRPRFLLTEAGLGYRLCCDEDAVQAPRSRPLTSTTAQ
jgi:two-component system KDP operon response regulator KdpE